MIRETNKQKTPKQIFKVTELEIMGSGFNVGTCNRLAHVPPT